MRMLAAVLITIPLLVLPIFVIALLDPVGTKLADDSDPFGTPPSRVATSFQIIAALGCIVIGLVILHRDNKKRSKRK